MKSHSELELYTSRTAANGARSGTDVSSRGRTDEATTKIQPGGSDGRRQNVIL